MKNNSIHVAFVIGSMRAGGAERATLNLINGLSQRGMSIDLVLLSSKGEFFNEISKSIHIVSLNKSRTIYSVNTFQNYLKENNPDIIVAIQNHIQLLVLLSIKFSHWKGKIILNEQSTYSRNVTGIKGRIQKLLSKYLFQSAHVITSVSKGVKEDFTKSFPALQLKNNVIPNAIITDQFDEYKNHTVKHHFFEEGKGVVVTAGRLVKSKNFALLLKAFAVAKKEMDIKLIILGDGPELFSLQQIAAKLNISDDVSFQGYVPYPSHYFSKASVFVLSSDYEGLPAVIIEALACGCKIVSTNCENGPAEILANGDYGWLVPVGEVKALSLSILTALKTEIDSNKLIERSKEFHQKKVVEQYESLFNELISDKQ